MFDLVGGCGFQSLLTGFLLDLLVVLVGEDFALGSQDGVTLFASEDGGFHCFLLALSLVVKLHNELLGVD